MLGKLLKYDFRSMWKSFALIWPAALVLDLVNHFTLPYDNAVVVAEDMAILSVVMVIAFTSVLFAMFVAVMIFIIQRFYRGLLGDEGYLMHTLPVKTWQLVLSKLICAVVTSLASLAVIFLACLLMVPIRWTQVLRVAFFHDLWDGLISNPDSLLYLLEFAVLVVCLLLLSITMAYFAMAVGHLFRRRIMMSVVAFIGLDILGTLYLNLLETLNLWDTVLYTSPHATFLGISLITLVPSVVLTASTIYLLSHRLNLE